METIRQLGNYRVTQTDAEFHCVHKPRPGRLFTFCVFLLFWTIICVVLCVAVYEEGLDSSLLFFAILFCAFECLLLYCLAHVFFGKETLVLNADGFQYCRVLFCFCTEIAIPIHETHKVTGEILKKDIDDACVYGILQISSLSGQSIKLVERIPKDDLCEMLDLLHETYEQIRPNDLRRSDVFSIVEAK